MDRIPPDRCKMPPSLWHALEQLGVSPVDILRQARLPSTLFLDPHAMVTTDQLFAIWRAAETLSGDPTLGLRIVDTNSAGGHLPIFLAASYAADYRDALLRILRFKRLTSSEDLQFVEADGLCTITKTWPHTSAPEPLLLYETGLAFTVELGRRGTGHPVRPARIELVYDGPRSAHREAYFDCPIVYGAPRNLIVLKTEDLDRPFLTHNAEMLDILTPALTAALTEPSAQPTVTASTKSALKRRLPSGRPEVADIARDLGMSERTLQRRITEENSSFRALLAEARRELSHDLLVNPDMGVEEVACVLGYQDTTSFYRAFREWEGTTPAQWLARQTA